MAGNDGMLGSSLSGGYLPPVNPGSSQEVQIKALNDVIARLNQLLKSQIFSDGTTKRMIIGFQQDGWGTGNNFGIKVSKPGVDVTTAADTDLLFKMDLASWNWYDPTTSTNPIRIGLMPDGTYDIVVVTPGSNVNDAF